MGKYRKKPVIIVAEQWFKLGDVSSEIGKNLTTGWVRDDCKYCGDSLKVRHGYIRTLEGGHIVCPGDWIITGVKGEKYPCKPDVFEQTYEKVD